MRHGPKREYARGHNAVAECQRSGQKMRYRDLVEDGHIEGLLVHPDWWEPKHPQEIPVEVTDPIALRRPAPEISIEPGYGDPEGLDGWIAPTDIYEASALIVDDFNRAGVPATGGEPPITVEESAGPLWITDTAFDWGPLVLLDGSRVEDPPFPPLPSVRNWADVHHTAVMPADQYAMIEFTNYRNVGSSGDVASWLWLRADDESGYYFYIWPDLPASNTLNADFGFRSGGTTNWYTSSPSVSVTGSMPDGLRVRAEAIGDQLALYYDDGSGWQTLIPPTTVTDRLSAGRVGFGFENANDNTACSVTNFWAGASAPIRQGLIGSVNGAVAVLDDFDRTGPSMGTDWLNGITTSANYEIIGNQLQVEAASVGVDYCRAEYLGQEFLPDQYASVRLYGINPATYSETSLQLRSSPSGDSQDGIYCTFWVDNYDPRVWIHIGLQVDGVWDYFANGYTGINAADVTDGTIFRAEVTGDLVSVYIGDELSRTLRSTDSEIGNHGWVDGSRGNNIQLWTYTDAAAADMIQDDFRAGSLNTTGASLTGGESLTKDDFNRTGPGLGSDWTNPIAPYYSMEIVDNALQVEAASVGDDYAQAWYVGQELSPNQYVSVELSGFLDTAYSEMSIALRASAQNQYYCNFWVDHFAPFQLYTQIGKQVNGVWDYFSTYLTQYPVADIAGTTMLFRAEIIGSTISNYINGELVFSITNSEIDGSLGNNVGLWAYCDTDATNMRIDNFRAGNTTFTHEPFQHSFTGTLEFNLTGGERSVAISEAITHEFNAWLLIDLDDGTQFITRIATGSDSPTFLLPLTTAFPAGQLASAGNTFYIGAA